MHKKQHLTSKGFQEILSIKAAMRNSLTGTLAENFPNTLPLVLGSYSLPISISTRREEESARSPLANEKIINPNWIVGFTEGKGSFKIDVPVYPSGLPVKLNFQILIPQWDKELLALIINYFNCGTSKIEDNQGSSLKIFTVTNIEDIFNIIITFFKKYPLQGMKKLDLDLFIKVVELIKTKGDPTSPSISYGEELDKILGPSKKIYTPKSESTFVPFLVYPNADTEKALIVKNNTGKSGVYCWVNNESGTRYVGSSIDLGKKFLNYYNLKHLIKNNMSIYKALLKYGHSKFSLEILEYCDLNSVIEREQYYIDFFKPEYNILKVAGSPLGYKHTPEAIKKLILLGTGRKISEETKAKLRPANLGSSVSDEIKN
uniref:hypothetical protein n=1 Tax=Phyllosticta yuccae TaxID=1151444 RepID=UPI00279D5229|nr:hypothetical protein QLP54_mgp05 [Phyllosticta yuccae]WGC90076.1 hypothetical protein [Phyllosticta yuccae]